MFRNTIMAMALGTLAAVSMPSYAQPQVKMDMISEKEIKVQEGGKTVVKRVPAPSSKSGEVLIFTIRYHNEGNEKATRVQAKNEIPSGMTYVLNSATGSNSDVLFSADGGKTFGKAADLTIEKTVAGKKELVKATPSDYTTIEWVIGEIGPGQSGELGYRAQMQ